jgi:CBS domain-containing protein
MPRCTFRLHIRAFTGNVSPLTRVHSADVPESSVKAREVMKRSTAVVAADDRISAAAVLMGSGSEAFVPVVRSQGNPRLVGVITARDIAVRCVARHQARNCRVADHMTPMPLHTAHPEDDVGVLCEQMELAGVRRIPVVSDDGMLLGVVAEADVIERGAERRREERVPRSPRVVSPSIMRAD